jgi:hypothetical protein
MDLRRWTAAIAALGAAAAFAADPPQPQAPRTTTPAEEGIRNGSGTAANGGELLGSATADAGGTTIGSGADTATTPGLAVDTGTVMRPLSAEGRNGLRPPGEPRRKQLYGINPKAEDNDRVTSGSAR